MADLRGPIRKLESRARHHRAIASLDTEAAAQAGDAMEYEALLASAEEHSDQAESYEEAIAILTDEMQRRGDEE